MRQGSALFSILPVLYIVSFIYIIEIRAQALNLNTSFLSFVDDNLNILRKNISYNPAKAL